MPITPTETPTKALEAPTDSPAPAAIQLSAQPYTSPIEAFSIYFPQDWNCSESGLYQVDCQSPQGEAEVGVRVIGTGYELYQQDFESLAHAQMVFQYREKKAYTESFTEVEEGLYTEMATWREEGRTWQSEDRFYREGAAIYQLHFRGYPEKWAAYAPVFHEISERTTFYPEKITNQPLYAITREYTAPDTLFKLDVPTTWSRYVDAVRLEDAILEGFLSPDNRASVQVVVFRQGQRIDQERKAFKTLEIMRDLYGFEWDVLDDRALSNGLEQLEWYAPRFDVYGFTYFDTYLNTLYLFSIIWDEPTEMIYLPVLEEIVASFRYE